MLGVYEFIFKSIPQGNGEFKYVLGKQGEGHSFKVLAESYEDSVSQAISQIRGILDCLQKLNNP